MNLSGYLCTLVFNVVFAVSQGEQGTLLLTDGGRVQSVQPGGGDVTTVKNIFHSLRGITYNRVTRIVYVVDRLSRTKIHRVVSFPMHAPQNLTSVVNFPDSGSPRGITVDSIRNHLYVSDYGRNIIYRVKTDGSGLMDWIQTQGGAYDVAVAEVAGLVYWSEFNYGSIMRVSVTDNGQKEVFLNGTVKPHGLYIDENLNTIYWCERDSGKVKSARLDGSHEKTIKTIWESTYGLRFMSGLPGHLYITDRGFVNMVFF